MQEEVTATSVLYPRIRKEKRKKKQWKFFLKALFLLNFIPCFTLKIWIYNPSFALTSNFIRQQRNEFGGGHKLLGDKDMEKEFVP